MSKLSVVSLFSGCGGLDLGFKENGFDLIYACDNDPDAIEIYRANIDKSAYVRDVRTEQFHAEIKEIGRCDVVLGGFPCQGFSKAGPKKSDDERNFLYLEMKRAIMSLEPDIFIAENVDGLSQNFKGKFIEQITKDFEQIGYEVICKIHDSASYGVPQHRRRIYFVGTKNSIKNRKFEWPGYTHLAEARNGESRIMNSDLFGFSADGLEKVRTIRDAIYKIKNMSINIPDHVVTNMWDDKFSKIIEKIEPGKKLCNVRFSDTSVYTWNIPEVYGLVDKEEIFILETIGKNRRHKKYGDIPNGNPLPEAVIKELTGLNKVEEKLRRLKKLNYLKESGDGYDLKGAMFCSGLFKRPLWDEPSPTVLTNFHNPRYFLHPEENRPFSLRECARLQGFPDDFLFQSEKEHKKIISGYRLVGNAVSPPVARYLAASVKTFLSKEGYNEAPAYQFKPRRATA